MFESLTIALMALSSFIAAPAQSPTVNAGTHQSITIVDDGPQSQNKTYYWSGYYTIRTMHGVSITTRASGYVSAGSRGEASSRARAELRARGTRGAVSQDLASRRSVSGSCNGIATISSQGKPGMRTLASQHSGGVLFGLGAAVIPRPYRIHK